MTSGKRQKYAGLMLLKHPLGDLYKERNHRVLMMRVGVDFIHDLAWFISSIEFYPSNSFFNYSLFLIISNQCGLS